MNEALYVALGETIRKDAANLGLDIAEFDAVMNPITESCTKDSISNGKHLIFTHATSPEKNEWIASYLLYRYFICLLCISCREQYRHECSNINLDKTKKHLINSF